MNNGRFKISLRIRHPTLDPDQITSLLRIKPRYRNKVGDTRSTPRGEAHSGVYSETYWSATIPQGNCESIEESIQEISSLLKPRAPELRVLLGRKGSIDIFIGWFISWNSGLLLPASMLKELSAMDISIGIDAYSEDDTKESERSDSAELI